MELKVLQLNIEAGRQFDTIISYLKQESFDIIHLQEVCGGQWSKSGSDNFQELKETLDLHGEIAVMIRMNEDRNTYFGNATFYSEKVTLMEKEIIWLKPYQELSASTVWEPHIVSGFSRNALSLLFESNGKQLRSINTHLAWGPDQKDEPYKVDQGLKLFDYISRISNQFVLTGDFNVDNNSAIVKAFDTIAVNHAVQSGITNTLNPRLHRATHLFPPGLGVDFLYTSPSLATCDFALIEDVDLSDHLGLKVTIKL